jgi:hypothetical protein
VVTIVAKESILGLKAFVGPKFSLALASPIPEIYWNRWTNDTSVSRKALAAVK